MAPARSARTASICGNIGEAIGEKSIVDKLIIISIVLVAWFWHGNLKAREIAMQAARRACAADELQLLDETVFQAGMKLARDEQGRLALRRVYQFEYSDTGDNRRRGSVCMLGGKVVLINVGLRLAALDGRLL